MGALDPGALGVMEPGGTLQALNLIALITFAGVNFLFAQILGAIQHHRFSSHTTPSTPPALTTSTMATVYKSLSKANGSTKDEEAATKGPRKNKQRVLVLSSRGVTYRYD